MWDENFSLPFWVLLKVYLYLWVSQTSHKKRSEIIKLASEQWLGFVNKQFRQHQQFLCWINSNKSGNWPRSPAGANLQEMRTCKSSESQEVLSTRRRERTKCWRPSIKVFPAVPFKHTITTRMWRAVKLDFFPHFYALQNRLIPEAKAITYCLGLKNQSQLYGILMEKRLLSEATTC